MNRAGKLYLDLLVATDYPEQEPAHESANNWDLLWFMVPVVGFLIFIEATKKRHQRKGV